MPNQLLLNEALTIYRSKIGAVSNSNSWWQREARRGFISFGSKKIPTFKKKSWFVDKQSFYDALSQLDHKQKQIQQIDDEVKNKKYRLGQHRTSWGGYRNDGEFVFIWSDYQRMRMKSDGYWKCVKCNTTAETKSEHCTCSSCENWNGCSSPFKTTEIKCPKCGEVPNKSRKQTKESVLSTNEKNI